MKFTKQDLYHAFLAGYWLHLDPDNNDLETRTRRFDKWFSERFGN